MIYYNSDVDRFRYWNNKNKALPIINGIPVIVDNSLQVIDVEKTKVPEELSVEFKRLVRKAEVIQTKYIFYLVNGRSTDVDIMESNLTEIYDMALFLLCTGKSTIHYSKDYDCPYKLFKWTLHCLKLNSTEFMQNWLSSQELETVYDLDFIKYL